MTLVAAPGRLGNLKVGGGDTAVLGVRKVTPKNSWNTEKPMHLQDTAPSTLLNYKEWSFDVELTEDLADSGQDAIRSAFENGTSLAFKVYVDATHYYSSTAYVTKYESTIDPTKSNTATCTFEPYMGTALTPNL